MKVLSEFLRKIATIIVSYEPNRDINVRNMENAIKAINNLNWPVAKMLLTKSEINISKRTDWYKDVAGLPPILKNISAEFKKAMEFIDKKNPESSIILKDIVKSIYDNKEKIDPIKLITQ